MKNFILTLLVFVLAINLTLAQGGTDASEQTPTDTSYWQSEFSAGLNFNQAGFSNNWKAGGVNSVAFGSIIAGKALYQKDKISWDNELELLFGIVRNEGEGTRKSNDRIFLDTKLGYQLSNKWSSYFSVNYLSQFAEGYTYNDDGTKSLISKFMAPGYLTSSLGFEFKPNKEFFLRIGPFSPRFTFVTDNQIIANVPANYGVPAGETVRVEWLAMQVFASLDKNLSENLNLKSRYTMFANYETLSMKNIDHRLDVTLTAKISNIINVTLTGISLYDIDQDPGVQYSQGLALGILYKVGNKK
ncbi:DUF3078 domain-containing protein [Cyclobacterium marinum]|uniref:DUF3078 domain-containing protein n=1 Tax=Cyclobacterium marinum (strain ATCC 25205 / DSM 745 / LMG 13164 / NCIMB 1802) TaxID=880070 RepID=G0J7Y8_CYCMS|nr:DUF3078 domain-containing protein [Cyclobacterium marinum]AEL28657.1 hypothetical protein Cycma_4973 [Cyclobacterium marinum DSM 745]MBI0398499.1 DUF3078 domain-containing protein [Cyclobacterium marinum]